jgi:hypothetical protein
MMPGIPVPRRPQFVRVSARKRGRDILAASSIVVSLLNIATTVIVGFGVVAYSAKLDEQVTKEQASISLTRESLETVQQRIASLYGLYESQPPRRVRCSAGAGWPASQLRLCTFELPEPPTPEFKTKMLELDSAARIATVRIKYVEIRSVLYDVMLQCAQPRPYQQLEDNSMTMGRSLAQLSAGIITSLGEGCSGAFDIANDAVGTAIRAAE